MRHTLFDSIEDMLAPVALAEPAGARVAAVRRGPLGTEASAYSGSALEAVDAELAGGGTRRFVLKSISRAWDFFMRATDDASAREVRVWETGLLERLPPEIGHTVVSAARDGIDGFAILMRDARSALLLNRGRIEPDEHVAILEGLAAMHAAFWDEPALDDPAIGLCPPETHYHLISPAVARRHADAPGLLPAMIEHGWENLSTRLPSDLFDILLALTNDPTPLVSALAPYPRTLVHGDARIANIGVEPSINETPRPLLIDWAIAGRNVALLDVIWYLGARTPWLPGDRETALELYRAALSRRLGARWDNAWWPPLLDLSTLGGLIRFGWFTATEAARGGDAALADLRWWVKRARAGVARL
jgi:hypothetical protein